MPRLTSVVDLCRRAGVACSSARPLSHGIDALTTRGREVLLPESPIASDRGTIRKLRLLAGRQDGTKRVIAVRGELDRRLVEGVGLAALVVGPGPFAIADSWNGGELALPAGRVVLVDLPGCTLGRLSMLIRLQVHAGSLGVPLLWRVPERAARALNVARETCSFGSALRRCRAVVTTPGRSMFDAMRAGRGVGLIDEIPSAQPATDVWWHDSGFVSAKANEQTPKVYDPALVRVHTDPSSLLGSILAPCVASRKKQRAILALSESDGVDGGRAILDWLGLEPARSIVEAKPVRADVLAGSI